MESIQPTSLLHLGAFLAKAEYENPTGSVKDRAARFMIADAMERGLLQPGGTVVEPTSGNFGISLAACCRERRLNAVIVMPDSMSEERRKKMEALGARVILTPGGMTGAVQMANDLLKTIPSSVMLGQFHNPANPLAHYRTTGPEIWQQTQGKVDVFVAGVGTGGTITGTGRFLKEKNPKIQIIAVEPEKSPVLSGGRGGSHGIQGIGAGFLPNVLDKSVIDQVVTVTDADAFSAARKLGEVGIPVGISSGAAAWASAKIATENPDQCVVTIFPDSADRYHSLGL